MNENGEIGGEIQLGENRSTRAKKKVFKCHFIHHKYHMDCPGIESRPRQRAIGE